MENELIPYQTCDSSEESQKGFAKLCALVSCIEFRAMSDRGVHCQSL